MYIDKQVFQSLQQIKGISGVSILNNMGEILHSTIKQRDTNELASFLSGVSSILASDQYLGKASKIILKSPKDENIVIYMMDDKTIAVILAHKTSCTVVSQKIALLLEEYTEIQSINAKMDTTPYLSHAQF